jgi:general L-amino acid transport system permease protein
MTAPANLASPAQLPPPKLRHSPQAWLRENLFSTWYNGVITAVLLLILANTAIGFTTWALTTAQWAVIPARFNQFMVGLYPVSQYWRIVTIVLAFSGLGGLTWGVLARNSKLYSRSVWVCAGAIALVLMLMPTTLPYRLFNLGCEALVLGVAGLGHRLAAGSKTGANLARGLTIAWPIAFLLALWFVAGGLGLEPVKTMNWGGLLLAILMAIVSSVLAFPIGILLALGRQSRLPVIRLLATLQIEIVRGIPLTVLLFIGAFTLPYFLPGTVRPDQLVRALLALTLFCASYLAETIRGGLQAIPRGQIEAASALGLSTPLTLGWIVLPQALKITLPALVGLFIQMIQETTLVSIIGIVELMRVSQTILSNQEFVGRHAEVYLFVGALFWTMAYALSLGSRRLEKALNTSY